MEENLDSLIISENILLNEVLPVSYLKRNHIQFEFVTYVSLVTTLSLARKFNEAGIFISRARNFLKSDGESHIDSEYLKHSIALLEAIEKYIFRHNLINEDVAQILQSSRNVG